MAWEDIVNDKEFQAQPQKIKMQVAENYFKQNMLADPDFQALPDQQRLDVTRNFFSTVAKVEGGVSPIYAPANTGPLGEGFAVDSGNYANNMNLGELNKILIPWRDAAIKSAPVAGAMLGASAAMPYAPALGPYAPVAPVLGAAIGGAAGATLGNVGSAVTGAGVEQSPARAGMEMGTAEAIPFGPVVSKVLGPAREAFMASPMAQKLVKTGQPFSPSTIVKSKLSSLLESATNLIPTGKAVTEAMQNKTYRWLMGERNKFLEGLTGQTFEDASTFIRQSGSARVAAKEEARGAYSAVVDAAGGGEKVIPMGNTKEYFDSIYEGATPNIKKIINDFRTRLTTAGEAGAGTGMTARDFDELRYVISKNGKGMKDNINAVVNKDLAAFDQAQGAELLQAVKDSNVAWIKSKGFEYVNGLFRSSTKMSPGGQEVFMPNDFYGKVMNPKTQEMIKKNFGNTALENLKDFAEQALKVGEEMSKKEGSTLGNYVRQGMVLGSPFAAIQNPMLLMPYGIAPVLAWRMMSPRSAFKKWLTEGLSTTGATEGLKMGGRAVMLNKQGKEADASDIMIGNLE